MNKLDNLKVGSLIAIQGIYAGHEEYDAIKGMVSEMSPDGTITVSTGSLGDVQLEKGRIDPEHLNVVQFINDDFDRAFLTGRNVFEARLDGRLAKLSRRAGLSQKKISTLADPAIAIAKSFRAIPHTSSRGSATESGKSPRQPIDYTRNPR